MDQDAYFIVGHTSRPDMHMCESTGIPGRANIFWNHFVLGHFLEVELPTCRHEFGSCHRGMATPDYDLNFDPKAC